MQLLPVFTGWLAVYVAVHLKLAYGLFGPGGADDRAFAKYMSSKDNRKHTAARVYYAKSSFMIVLLVLQGALGFDFHTAAVWSFALYAAEMNMLLNQGPTTATKVYAAGALALLIEWALVHRDDLRAIAGFGVGASSDGA